MELVGTGTDNVTDHSPPWELFFPPPSLCTDNGVMAAWAGIEKFRSGISESVYDEENGDLLEPLARWPMGPSISRQDTEMFRKRTRSRHFE